MILRIDAGRDRSANACGSKFLDEEKDYMRLNCNCGVELFMGEKYYPRKF